MENSLTKADRQKPARRNLQHLNLAVQHSVLGAQDQATARQVDRQGLGPNPLAGSTRSGAG